MPFAQLSEAPPGQTSAEVLATVVVARARQADRFGSKGPLVNGRMTPRQVRKYCVLKPEATVMLRAAMEEFGLSARRTTRCCGWPGRWPTSKARPTSSRTTSPRRWGIARSTGAFGREGVEPFSGGWVAPGRRGFASGRGGSRSSRAVRPRAAPAGPAPLASCLGALLARLRMSRKRRCFAREAALGGGGRSGRPSGAGRGSLGRPPRRRADLRSSPR